MPTLTQHLLLQLPLAWRGPGFGTAPACLTLTHLSVCLSVSRLAHEGPVLPEAEPLPFNQVTGLRWGTFKPHEGKGRGAGDGDAGCITWGLGPTQRVGCGPYHCLLLVVGEEGARASPGEPAAAWSAARGTPQLSDLDGSHIPARIPLPCRACSPPIPLLPLLSGTNPPPQSLCRSSARTVPEFLLAGGPRSL